MLSIIILTRNEEKWIEGALRSAVFADEVIVVDSQSEDKTLKIAQKYPAKIYVSKGKSFADWRNFGLKKAKSKWIFYLDADERITQKLKQELLSVIKNSQLNSYAVPRRNFYFGFPFFYGQSYPDYQHRLFKREKLVGWEGVLHERPILKDPAKPVGKLKNSLWHFTHRNIESMVNKTNKWSVWEAEQLLTSQHPPMVWWRFFSIIFKTFFEQFFVFKCWRDGTKGVVEGLFQIFSKFITYAKLWELQQKDTAEQRYRQLEKKLGRSFY